MHNGEAHLTPGLRDSFEELLQGRGGRKAKAKPRGNREKEEEKPVREL